MVSAGVLLVCSYLLGSIVSAVIVCRAMGLSDPRAEGSGNPGATNVLRLHGRLPAALTLAGDVAKGLAPVAAARWLEAGPVLIAGAGLLVILGHLYPVYYSFRGGKGVATLLGVLFGTSWMLGVAFALTWAVIAAAFRYSSMASLCAAAMTPVYTWWVLPDRAYVVAFIAAAAVLTWRHRSNIRNVIDGREDKIGYHKA